MTRFQCEKLKKKQKSKKIGKTGSKSIYIPLMDQNFEFSLGKNCKHMHYDTLNLGQTKYNMISKWKT